MLRHLDLKISFNCLTTRLFLLAPTIYLAFPRHSPSALNIILMSLLLASSRRALLRPALTSVRFNSTAARASAEHKLTWDQFLTQRFRRRRINVGASIFTGFLGVTAGWATIANIEIDPTQLIFGFDPLQVLPVVIALFAGVGALFGPSLGNIIFRASLGKNFAEFNVKNAEFLRHVKKMRPDPSKQTFANPVPDYYGEKIGSLKDYKRWLRDGKAYRRKCENFL